MASSVWALKPIKSMKPAPKPLPMQPMLLPPSSRQRRVATAVGSDSRLLAGRVGSADGAVVLDAFDIRLEVGEDGDLARKRICGVGALDLGFDAVHRRQVIGVVGTGRLCQQGAACEAQQSRE